MVAIYVREMIYAFSSVLQNEAIYSQSKDVFMEIECYAIIKTYVYDLLM